METMFRRSMFTSFTWYSQQFRGNIWQTVFPSKTTTAKWKSRYKLYLRKSHNDCYLLCWLSMRREYDSTHTGYKYEDRNERWVWKMHNVQDKKIRTKSLIMHFTSRNGVPGWLRGAVVATCRMDPISRKSLNQDIYNSKYISSTFSRGGWSRHTKANAFSHSLVKPGKTWGAISSISRLCSFLWVLS